jgi:hypothetical protein
MLLVIPMSIRFVLQPVTIVMVRVMVLVAGAMEMLLSATRRVVKYPMWSAAVIIGVFIIKVVMMVYMYFLAMVVITTSVMSFSAMTVCP